jgi:peptide/nickel transport system permease protein
LNIGTYIIRRTILVAVVVIGTITVTFFLSHVIPGNSAILLAGQNPTPGEIAKITHDWGLDKPLWVQYVVYLQKLLSGDFGVSYSFSLQPVLPLVLASLPNTFTLAAIGTLLAAVIGIPLGVEAARRSGKWLDSTLRIFSVSFVALPQFWLALLFQLAFAVYLHILPLSSYGGTLLYTDLHPITTITGSYFLDTLLTGNFQGFAAIVWSMILPVVTLALYPIGVVVRQTRASMVGILSQDYVRTAKAYGISERDINYRFALRNALPPVLVVLALIFAGSVIGVVFVEEVFALYPGLGFMILQGTGTNISSTGISTPDVPLILGITIITSLIYAISNFAADMLQIYFDRRVLR